MKSLVLLIFVFCLFHNCKTTSDNDKSKIFLSKLNNLYSKVSDPVNLRLLLGNNYSKKLRDSSSFNDTLCTDQFQWFQNGLNKTEMWALNIFDSWGKIPSGIFYGNSYEFGNFDQCLEIDMKTNLTSSDMFKGQYCLNIITFDLNALSKKTVSDDDDSLLLQERMMPELKPGSLALGIGSCVPSSCSPAFVKKNLENLAKSLNLTVAEYDPDEKCYRNEDIKLEAIDIVAILIFSFIILLMIGSTIYDLTMRYYNKTSIPYLSSFSIYTNGQRLFSCKKSSNSDVMYCLNGIRCISIVWVVFGHAYLLTISGAVINLATLSSWVKNWHSLLLLSGTISVDTFFLLSGLLVTRSVLNELNKRNGKLNIPLMYFHRYLRLTPSFAALILLCVSLFRYIGTGPLWKTLYNNSITHQCNKYWWSTLLYVQNYVNPEGLCLGHSWYLSVDMQLFLLSPLILYPLWKWGKKFVGIIVVLILLSMGCVFATFYKNEFKLNVFKGSLENADKNKLLYYPTHTRMGSWLIGVLLGYILNVLKDTRINLSKYWIILGWTVSFGTILAIIFGPYNIQQKDYVENIVESAFYETLSRVSWSIAVSWIIFICVKGHGGAVNWFLSLAFWQPFARLSYSIYLLHLVLQSVMLGSTKVSNYFSDISTIHKFWGDFGLTLTMAIFWTLAFESPITVLEKYLIKKKSPTINSRENLIEQNS